MYNLSIRATGGVDVVVADVAAGAEGTVMTDVPRVSGDGFGIAAGVGVTGLVCGGVSRVDSRWEGARTRD